MDPTRAPLPDVPQLTLSDRPADASSRRAALIVVALSAGIFLALAPLANVPLAQAHWFIPLVQSVLITNDLITAALLFGQLRFRRQTAILVLASGYVFAAVMASIHLLTFPGVFSTGGLLGAGAQTTGYLHVFWHLGLPVAVMAYTVLRERRHKLGQPVVTAIGRALLAVALLAGGLALLATRGNDLLPPMLDGIRYSSAFNIGRYGQWAVTALAIVVLWRRRRHSVLDLWLLVMLCDSFFEIALVSIFNAGRYDVGFYAGRVYATFASSIVLVMLLVEQGKMYRELAAAQETARSEAALRESREVLRLAMHGGRMAAWTRDLERGTTWWSPEVRELTGWPSAALGASDAFLFERVHPDDRDAVRAMIDPIGVAGGEMAVEFRLRHADGSWRWLDARCQVVPDEDDGGLRLFGVAFDITVQKRSEEALRVADRRKDEFIATLAHELRNPLAPIRTAVELIGRAGPLPATVTRMRDILDRQSRHLTRLVDDLLEVSRITQGKLLLRRSTVALSECLRDAVHAARPGLEASGHQLVVHADPHPLYAHADATRITQAVVNLLNNASKFTPAGGRIVVSSWREGGDACICVSDDGIGIAPEHLHTIFGMFSQVSGARERSHGGLGIGLALVRGFVELHGGTVEARSAGAGKGSQFLIRLPLLQSEAPVAQAGRHAARPAMLHRVLVVDDNQDAASSLAALLAQEGFDVRVAHGGAEALSLAFAFEPEAVLLDIGMPGINGLEVARELRRRMGPGVRLIAVTGWGQARDRELTREAGFDFHLTKPVDQAEVEALLAASIHPGTTGTPWASAQRH